MEKGFPVPANDATVEGGNQSTVSTGYPSIIASGRPV